jgi:hypothetical protein
MEIIHTVKMINVLIVGVLFNMCGTEISSGNKIDCGSCGCGQSSNSGNHSPRQVDKLEVIDKDTGEIISSTSINQCSSCGQYC